MIYCASDFFVIFLVLSFVGVVVCVPRAHTIRASTYLGSLRKTVSSGNNFYLYANKNDNPPVYIPGRSNNTRFLVAVLTDQGAGYDGSSLGSYILTLYFEPA